MFTANYSTKQEKISEESVGVICCLCCPLAMDQASKLEALAALSLTLLVSKVMSFESSEVMPTVIAAVLSPVEASSSSWTEKKELLLRLD